MTIRTVVVIFLVAGVLSARVDAQSPEWPRLPSQGFMRDRAATKADLAAGDALFVAALGEEVVGTPLKIAIPQYAYFKDGNRLVPVIIVQAEEAGGKRLVGARELDGTPVVGFITDFELLGAVPPANGKR